MPFQKITGGKFKSPSGKLYTKKQVALYYANDGFPDKKRTAAIAKRAHKKRSKK